MTHLRKQCNTACVCHQVARFKDTSRLAAVVLISLSSWRLRFISICILFNYSRTAKKESKKSLSLPFARLQSYLSSRGNSACVPRRAVIGRPLHVCVPARLCAYVTNTSVREMSLCPNVPSVIRASVSRVQP